MRRGGQAVGPVMLSELWRMRDDASDGLPSPAESRRRARLRGGAILVGLTVLIAVPTVVDLGRHREPRGVAIGFAALGTLILASLPQQMANAHWSVWSLPGAKTHVLAARTMTGWRTVDLKRIRRVHMWSIPSRFGSASYVMVIDANGSRIGVRTTDPVAIRWVRDAVVASAKSTEVRASNGALISLEIHREGKHPYRPCHDAHPLLYALAAWAVLNTIWAGAVTLFLR
jgi:hypothetical protein